MAKIADNKEYFQHNFDKILLNSSSVNGVEFEDCHFNECDFSQASILECKFINCTFQRCNLSLLKISGSTFTEVEFLECKLVGIDWTLATWSDFNIEPELVFKKCLLNDGSFFGLSLHKLTFDGCKLHDVDFREGDFNGSIMTDCDFSYSLFMKTNLQGVDFTESAGFTINIFDNQLTQAKFSRYAAMSLLDSLDIELVD